MGGLLSAIGNKTYKKVIAETAMTFLQLGKFYLAILVKYSFVSLITTGLNKASEIKLGIAISPFNVSAIDQASLSSTVPAMLAKRQKITRYTLEAL